tara:strand:- start:2268 stop:5150 length:2883 start_codon:yes stop_codon:yes gene_type:complete
MSDTNLDPSITALTNRASTVAVTATARELMNLSRLAPSLEQSENTDLEVAINARAEDLAPSATATELKSIGKAIGNVLEPETFVAGGTLPNQAQNSGNFLATNGTAESWGGLSVSTLSEVNISSIMNDETLVYNHVNGLFENNSQVFRIQEIGLTENIPASGAFEGQVVFDQQTSELKYWDGSEWKVAAVVAAAGGGGTSTVDWTGSQTTLATLPRGSGTTRFGRMVVMNSTYVAVSDYEFDQGGYTDNGKVTVYLVADGSEVWTVYGTESHNYHGYTNNGEKGMFMSENLLVINDGATRSYGDTGARVRLYDVTNGNLLGTFDVSGDTNISVNASNHYGRSVAINDDETKLAIGSPEASPSTGGKWGRFSVYDISDLNNLSNTPIHSVGGEDLPASDTYSLFGFDLDFSGVNTLVVSAPDWKDGGVKTGRTFIFDLTAAGNGLQQSLPGKAVRVIASGGEYSGGNLVVVASDWQADPTENGLVKIWDSNSFGTATPTATINYPDGGANARFGHSTAFDGNYILVAGLYANTDTTGGGQIYVYNLDGTSVSQISSPNPTTWGSFGFCVAVDASGSGKWAVGATGEAKVYVFQQAMSGGGSGSSYTVVDWTAADSTLTTIWGSRIGHTLTSTQLSDGRNVVIAAVNSGHFYAYDLADNSLIWTVSTSGHVPDDNGAMASSGDYFAAVEGGSVRVRSALDGSAVDGGSVENGVESIPGWGIFQVESISMHGNYIFLPRTAYNEYAMVKWDTREIVWQYNSNNHPWNIVNSNPNAGIAAYNHDMGENYLAVQDMYSHSGAYQAGCVYVVDVLTGQEISRLDDPNPRVNGRFGGIGGRENGIAVSGDKAIIGDPEDGHGKVHIFDMPTGTLEFTIDENTAGGSGITTYARQSIAGYNFGQEIEAYGDYALISHNWDSFIVQISTGEIKHETDLLNIDRVTIVENYAIGGDLNTQNLRIIKGIIS